MALNLKDKWEHLKAQRAELAIEEAEDDEGNLNDDDEDELSQKNNDRYMQYRRMLKKLEAYKRHKLIHGNVDQEENEEDAAEEDDEEEEIKEPEARNRQLMPPPASIPQDRGGELEMTIDGMRLPDRNAFDFTVRPSRDSFRGFN